MADYLSATFSQFAALDTETVVIDRRTPTATAGQFTYTVIYSGACDFQSKSGTQFTNPAGVVDVADAVLYINAVNGVVPVIEVGDRATVTQNGVSTVYNIANVGTWIFAIPHLELTLKRGPVAFKNK